VGQLHREMDRWLVRVVRGVALLCVVLMNVVVTGCAMQQESEASVDGIVCLGLCYLLKVDAETDSESEGRDLDIDGDDTDRPRRNSVD
jgi:hypothetical protein